MSAPAEFTLQLGTWSKPISEQLTAAGVPFDAVSIARFQKISDALDSVLFARVVARSVVFQGRDRLAKQIAASLRSPLAVQTADKAS